MKTQYTLLVLCIITIVGNKSAFCQADDIETLKGINHNWIYSYPKKDKATLDKIFASDFVLINHKGAKMTKKNILDNLDKQDISSVNIDSVDVRLVTKDVAIITAYTTFTVLSEGKEMTGKNCYQDVYMKRKEKWVAVSAHVTLLSFK